jgi:N-acylglucosamine 2-epimerase
MNGFSLERAAALRQEFSDELLGSVVPFWEKFSPDREYGGCFSCLDRDGTVFDTDKFLWMQGRALWCWSHLSRTVEPREAWLSTAKLVADFLREHGRAENGDWYFSLDRSGRPLVQPYNIFADCFCAAGLAEYSRIAEYGRIAGPDADWAGRLAVDTWRRIQVRKSNPKGPWTKQIAANRPVRAMAMPMIQLWMASVFEGLLPQAELDAVCRSSIEDVLRYHINPEKKVVFERSLPDGSRPQGMEGRLLTPGHALEALWFILERLRAMGPEGMAKLDLPAGYTASNLVAKIVEAMLWTVERGWDPVFGGIFYYMDQEGRPTEKIEHSMKLWWVHNEALCAFLLAHRMTGSEACLDWFEKIWDWSKRHFSDPVHGEWYGYLDRRGDIALSLKGGKWKGMFHVPRALLVCERLLGEYGGTEG